MKDKQLNIEVALRRNKIIDEMWYVTLPAGMTYKQAFALLLKDPLVIHEWASSLESTDDVDTVGTTYLWAEEI